MPSDVGWNEMPEYWLTAQNENRMKAWTPIDMEQGAVSCVTTRRPEVEQHCRNTPTSPARRPHLLQSGRSLSSQATVLQKTQGKIWGRLVWRAALPVKVLSSRTHLKGRCYRAGPQCSGAFSWRQQGAWSGFLRLTLLWILPKRSQNDNK